MIFLMDMPVVSWRWWATASEVMTMVRWATGGVALVVEDGAGFQVVLGHAPGGLDVSQLAVGGDDLGGAMRSLAMLVTWPLVRREVALECWVFFGLCVFCVSCCDFAAQ